MRPSVPATRSVVNFSDEKVPKKKKKKKEKNVFDRNMVVLRFAVLLCNFFNSREF